MEREMKQTEKLLEFDKIKEKWKELAYTAWAKRKIEETEPFLSESSLLHALAETTEARLLLEKGGTPPPVSLNGVEELVTIAQKEGCLTAAGLEQIGSALAAVKRLKDYLNRCKQYEASLPYYEENLDAQEALAEQIRMQIRNGSVDDEASKLLKSLRCEMERLRDKAKEKADSVMRANRDCMSDSFSTMRNGRLCIPVKKEYKFKIAGSVVDKSATGSTLFIEPASVSKICGEMQTIAIETENEERRILFALTAMVAEAAEVMEQNMRTIEKLDFIFSKGKLSIEYDGNCPQINTERRIVLQNGRHPLMDKKICVPLQFTIGSGISGIVITGPNTGGKTVAIKTAALTCMMAQCGLHVACEEADICMNSNFLCDIGDGQNLSENLSTFSAHIKNVMDILEWVTPQSLVVMDELGSGTDPMEGMGIAIAILEELKKSGALFLVTTHYPEVKQYAEKEERIVNARMAFDKESLKPLYKLIIGEAGESCAFYIAGRLGMPDYMLRCAAKAAYGENASDMPKFLLKSEDSAEVWETDKERDEKEPQRLYGTKAVPKAASRIIEKKKHANRMQEAAMRFKRGDSVMVYPDKKIGIVCQSANEKGVLRVQLPDRKIWINHKRLRLHVAAKELYPEDYDFSIIFDTIENRKLRHKMGKHHIEGTEITIED